MTLRFEAGSGPLSESEAELVAVAAIAAPSLPEDEAERVGAPPAPMLGPGADAVEEALGIDLSGELAALRFDGSVGSVARIPTRGAIPAGLLLVVGVGKADDLDAEAFRKGGAALADASARKTSLATTVHAAGGDAVEAAVAAQALVEGTSLGAYRFNTYRSKGEPHELEVVQLHPAGDVRPPSIRKGIERGTIFADGTRLARDLVNEPSAAKRPPALADRIREEFDGTGVRVEVLDEQALERGGYGGLIAVGKGSEAPPRLVELTYEPDGAKRHVALVGKGITFDSGGLSLKTGQGMTWMKADMGGAAAVAATVKAAAQLGVKVKLTGLLALAENMPSATAQRPGDVYTARNGKTVEVLNTDAEGRLVLSDALSHATEAEPDAIIDLATLTGAVIVALGRRIGGLMSPHDGLADALLAASDRSGERLWRLPLPDDYLEDLKSDIADLKNIGQPGVAGTVVAALFLKQFVGDGIPWAHLDIAGLAWSETQSGYIRKGGTGAPVRTLLHWLVDGAKLRTS